MKNINILKDLKTLNKLHTSSVESYTTNNGIVDFTCDNAGYVDNVVIEGKTLVNLASCDMGIRSLTESSGNIWTTSPQYGTFTNSNGLITFRTANEGWIDFGSIIPVTEGTSIRFIVNIIENGGTKTNCIAMFFNDMPVINSAGANTDKIISLNKIGTTTSLGLQDNQFKVPTGAKYALFIVSCSEPNTTYKFDNFMLLENNEDDFISYFEGLKSVGQGTDEISVSIVGDKPLISGFSHSHDIKTIHCVYTKHNLIEHKIAIEPYLQSFNNVGSYDNCNNLFDYYITNDGSMWINLGTFDREKALQVLNYKIAEINGRANKKQISTTLRSLPNGVKDTIEKRGNKYVKVQRCRELHLDGNSTFFSISEVNPSTKIYRVLLDIPLKDNKPGGKVFCDRFNSYANWELDEEECYVSINKSEGNAVCLKILKTRLENTMTKEKLLAWLDANPTTIVYELEKPIITELPNFNSQTYKGENTLVVNSGVIQCDANFDVCEGIRSELDVIKDKISSLDDTTTTINYRNLRDDITFLNGWNIWGNEARFNCYVADNIVKICILLKPSVLTQYTPIFKLPAQYITGRREFITCIDNDKRCYLGGLDESGIFTFENNISSESKYVAINFTYPLTKKVI